MMWLFNIPFFGFVILLYSYLWTSRIGAPWVPTPRDTVQQMLGLADLNSEDILYDLGCGDGRIVFTAAEQYGIKAVGIEIDPLRYLYCQAAISSRGLRDRVKIKFGNFFRHDLSDATVVTCYLLQDTNNKLQQKFREGLRPGTKIISNTFTFSEFDLKQENGDVRLYCNEERKNLT